MKDYVVAKCGQTIWLLYVIAFCCLVGVAWVFMPPGQTGGFRQARALLCAGTIVVGVSGLAMMFRSPRVGRRVRHAVIASMSVLLFVCGVWLLLDSLTIIEGRP